MYLKDAHKDVMKTAMSPKLNIIDTPSHAEEPSSLLGRVADPKDLRGLSAAALKEIAADVRRDIIQTVSKTGGHLGASLGVVELSVALHATFNTPEDRLIWDVGHQCYAHKILTGRRDKMSTLRKGGGLSGFTKRSESAYDPFGAGHCSTSISAGLGMAVARDLGQKDHDIICVIGDGSMSAGMAYEAMNNAGALKSRMIVILNDNDMSISPPVGALSKHLTKIVSSNPYIDARDMAKQFSSFLPKPLKEAARKAEETARAALGGGTLFEEMGFYYIGPIDGHNMDQLLPVLNNIKNAKRKVPVLLHVLTQKGKGYGPAERAPDKMHGVGRFNVVTGTQSKPDNQHPTYTRVFSDSLIREARKDDKIVAVTAAMPAGTGLDRFEENFPNRLFDVGIAEQHAVTFAAGLAAEGYKPFCAMYSTFLQRAYDQIVHDVALQNLPVRFAIDRAGLVGDDGATHAGAFDTAFLINLPNMVLMAAADEAELSHMVTTAAHYDKGPIAFRYPRGHGPGTALPDEGKILPIGKGRIIKEGTDIAILSYGTRLEESVKAADILKKKGVSATVADARFAKPLDKALIQDLFNRHHTVITVEEGVQGGFGSAVLSFASENGLLDGNVRIRTMALPDRFEDHDTPYKQYDRAALNAKHIAEKALLV